MKLVISSLSLLLGSTVFASPSHYRIEAQIFVDGKMVSSPRVMTYGSEPAEIIQSSENPRKEMKMKVVASDLNDEKIKDGIFVKLDVEYMADGRAVKASPQILAQAGSETTIAIGDDRGNQDVKMKIVAIRE